MQYRKLGTSELNVSVVGMGTWAIGGDFFGEVEEQQAVSAIQAALDAGINLVDTAPAYGMDGRSERIVGRALKGRRDQAILATKVGVLHETGGYDKCLRPESIGKEIEDSLRRLQVDVIDLYQVHWPDPETPLVDSLPALVKLREAGKVRYLGVSNFTIDEMDIALKQAGIVSCQPPYSMLDRAIEEEILPYCMKHNLGTLTYGSLSGGLLADRFSAPHVSEGTDVRGAFYPYLVEPGFTKVQGLLKTLREVAARHSVTVAQVVIAWTIAQPGVTCALVGATKPEQAADNAKAANIALTQEDLDQIDAAYKANIL